MYHEIYDEHGDMFEVTATRARALLAAGWTVGYPEDLSKVFEPTPEPVSEVESEKEADPTQSLFTFIGKPERSKKP